MAIVSAFLVPSSWGTDFAPAVQSIGDALDRSKPDVLLVFTTRWRSDGDLSWSVHDLPGATGFNIDLVLAKACMAGTRAIGVESAEDGEMDLEALEALSPLNPGSRPVVAAASNRDHDFNRTERLGGLAAAIAERLKRRVAVIGIGSLSTHAEPEETLSDDDDRWNRQILDLIVQGDVYGLRCAMPGFTTQARADNNFKHFAWVLGALSGVFSGATVHGYGAHEGDGTALIEFQL